MSHKINMLISFPLRSEVLWTTHFPRSLRAVQKRA